MRSLLKLVVLLYCIQGGEGRRLMSLIDRQQEAASARMSEAAEDGRTEASGAQAPPEPPVPAGGRSRRSAPGPECGLRSVLLQVRDLGLGYDSDESILFKYCGGTCPHARSNHDLALANLLHSGALPHPAPGGPWHGAPCCRPAHHEDVAFLDNSHRWHKVEKLSAAGCSCAG